MGLMDRLPIPRPGRTVAPDSRGVMPTHVPLKTLDNRELMAMFKKDIGGAPSGAMFGGWQAYGGSYTSTYRTGPSRMAKLQEAYGGTVDSIVWVMACHPAGTLVRRGDGLLTPIEDVREGDVVLTHAGRLRPVTDLIRLRHEGRLRFRRDAGPDIEATDEHPLLVATESTASQRFRARKQVEIAGGVATLARDATRISYDWKAARDIEPGDLLVEPISREIEDVERVEVSREITATTPAWARRYWDGAQVETTADTMRLVGYFLAEGWVTPKSVVFAFHEDEVAWHEDVRELMRRAFGVEGRRHSATENGRSATLTFNSRKAVVFFEQFGHGARHKTLPAWVRTLPLDKQAQMLLGWWRGDGTRTNRQFAVATASRQLAEDMRVVMLRLGIVASLRTISRRTAYLKRDGEAVLYMLTCGGGHARRFAELFDLATDATEKVWSFIAGDYAHYHVRGVERIAGECDVYNLEVAEDHSYIANGVASHNCTSLIASTVAAYPWRFVDLKDGTTIENPPADLALLLEHPNSDWTYFDLIEAVATDLELVGNCYILKNKLNGLKQPQELRRLRPERVQIALNPDGTVRGYVYTVRNGIQIPYDVDEVMHFKYPSPLDPYYGMGTVEALAPVLDRAQAQGGHVAGFFQNGGRISGILTIPETMSDKAFERLKATYSEQFAGPASAYKMLIAEGANDYKPINAPPVASGVVELMDVSKDEVLSGFGVPAPVLGGNMENANYKMEDAQAILLRALIPKSRRMAERISSDLTMFWGVGFRQDPHANEPMSVRAEYANKLIMSGAKVKEAREAAGLPALEPGDPMYALQDMILVPNTLIPLTLAGQPPRPAASMPITGQGESGAPGSNGHAPTLEEHLANLPAAIANGKDAGQVAALLDQHHRELRVLLGGKAADADDAPNPKSRIVPPGPWPSVPALAHLIEHRTSGGKDYNPDEPRDDHGRWTGGGNVGGSPQVAQPIYAHSLTGGGLERSRAVSADEFQQLATQGQAKLQGFADAASPTTGLDDNWAAVKANAYTAVQEPWGGATIDAHTGQAVASDANAYVLSVKPPGISTVSVPEGASQEDFNAAMDQARSNFSDVLQNANSHLGVFHDDAVNRIDIDPTIVVSSMHDVESIGAYTHAIGGAYNFADGNGYWPPHIDPTKAARRKSLLDAVSEASRAWGIKAQTVATAWTPPQLPRGFEPVTKATTTVEQDTRDVQARCLRHGVDIYEPAMRSFFRDQRERVIDALSQFGDVSQRGARLRHRPTKAKSDLTPDAVFNTAAEDDHLLQVYIPAAQDVLDYAADQLPATETQVSLEDLRDKLAGKVVGINETTRLAISDTVVEGLRRGYGIPQIANGYPDEKYPGIMGVFDQAGAARAETIARTESAFAFNGVQVANYRANDVAWVTILDGTEFDEACADADGQIWSLDDYEANPLEHPNCSRCAVPSDVGPDGETT